MHRSLTCTSDYPHTVLFACRKQMQIDSFMELPKDKRPPENIWDNPSKLNKWFDDVFDRESSEDEFELIIDESEIEGA